MHTKQIYSQYQFLYQLDKLRMLQVTDPRRLSNWLMIHGHCGLAGNQTVCHSDPFPGLMLMEKLPCATLPALQTENIAWIASQSFSPEMSHIILVHISLVQHGHAMSSGQGSVILT